MLEIVDSSHLMIDMEDGPGHQLPAVLVWPGHLSGYLATWPPTCLPSYLATYLSTWLPGHLPGYLAIYPMLDMVDSGHLMIDMEDDPGHQVSAVLIRPGN